MGKLFGTDGVRGTANSFLTPELTMEIGRVGAYILAGRLAGQSARPPKILIGLDTRLSGDMLEAALVAGLCSVGAEVHKAGVIPSPAMAYLMRYYKMDAGVMLSASHNPMADNGIKFFDSEGFKLSDEIENEIESYLHGQGPQIPRPVGDNVGRCKLCPNAAADYITFLAGTVNQSFDGMKVVLDCANGACSKVAPTIFKQLGADVVPIHYNPNGVNINLNCGSTHLESLMSTVCETKADIGLAFDGDGDRMLAVDDMGKAMDGDVIMAICGLALKKAGRLNNNSIVATVMSNLGLQKFCDGENIELLRTAVGDRYVIQEMKAGGYNLGGEQSGHIIFSDYNTTGDGVLTGLQLLSTLMDSKMKLSELRKIMKAMPQVLYGAKLDKPLSGELRSNEKIDQAIKELEQEFAGGDITPTGRVLVRPSGTEPLVRVMIEGQDESVIKKQAKALVALIEKELK